MRAPPEGRRTRSKSADQARWRLAVSAALAFMVNAVPSEPAGASSPDLECDVTWSVDGRTLRGTPVLRGFEPFDGRYLFTYEVRRGTNRSRSAQAGRARIGKDDVGRWVRLSSVSTNTGNDSSVAYALKISHLDGTTLCEVDVTRGESD